METHSSILACRTPWTEEPGGLQSSVAKSQTRPKSHNIAQHTPSDEVTFQMLVILSL